MADIHPDRIARRVAILAVVAVLVAFGAPTVLGTDPAGADELERFSDCAELQRHLDAAAAIGRTGLPGPTVQPLVGSDRSAFLAEEAAPTADAPASRAASGSQAPEDTGGAGTGATNVQVAGVDELDRVDVDGDRVLTVDDEGRVSLVDAGTGEVATGPDLPGFGHQLTWDTERGIAWVVSSSDQAMAPTVDVHRLRVGEAVTEDGTWSVTGWLTGVRRIDDRLHLVVNDAPATRGDGVVPFEGEEPSPVPCDQVWRPTEPAGPTALLVATLAGDQPGGSLDPVATTALVGAGEIVSSSLDALYVATPLLGPDGVSETSIHRFSLGDLAWTGSGRVPGTPLGQFALDEHEGVLRVATTVDAGFGIGIEPGPSIDGDAPVAGPAPPVADTDNLVVTLDTEGDLEELGRLAGLGKPGERIQGVRFDGDVAYVVTFRQTDPLYVVDLADPAAPRAVGELEIPGFSSYLHPVGDDLVVGVGQEGTADGTLLGAQAQLFDVSDRTAPRQVGAVSLGDYSEAADDHHAFADLGDGRFAVPAFDWSEGDLVVDGPRLRGVLLTVDDRALGVEDELDVSAPETTVEAALGPAVRVVAVDGGYAVVVVGEGVARFTDAGEPVDWIALGP